MRSRRAARSQRQSAWRWPRVTGRGRIRTCEHLKAHGRHILRYRPPTGRGWIPIISVLPRADARGERGKAVAGKMDHQRIATLHKIGALGGMIGRSGRWRPGENAKTLIRFNFVDTLA